jgi:hypothetical protein
MLEGEYLYHVTKTTNVESILEHGLQPLTVTPTGQRRAYSVEFSKLNWAIEHVMVRHEIAMYRGVSIIAVRVALRHDWKLYNRGIWYTSHTVNYFVFGAWYSAVAHLMSDGNCW